jgi:flagellar hook-basal body complex protein FliE
VNLSNPDMVVGGAGGALSPRLPAPAADRASGGGFSDVLRNLVDQVDTLQKDADVSINGLVTGATTNVHDVTIKMAEAGMAFDLMMQVRNKLLEAYQQIIKMQP